MNEGVAELRIPALRANLPNNFYSRAKRQGALVAVRRRKTIMPFFRQAGFSCVESETVCRDIRCAGLARCSGSTFA